MTTEVVVMNKLAVALAADSAVTVRYQQGNKIYNSANKLFSLSNHCPVGIMIYGSAELMGMPWETIITLYRKNLGIQKFNHLSEYANNFLTFLQSQSLVFFPEEYQAAYFYYISESYISLLKQDVDDEINKAVESEKGIQEEQRDQIVSEIINTHYELWMGEEILPHIPVNHIEEVRIKYGDTILTITREHFKGFSLSENDLNKVLDICSFLTAKNRFSNNFSGIVFAGFGESELFPVVNSYKVELVVNNSLKYAKDGEEEISYTKPVTITSFAQSDMIDTFMQGIHPNYDATLWKYLQVFFDQYPQILLNNISDLEEDEKKELLQKLKEASMTLLDDFKTIISAYRQREHIDPVVSNVGFLPIDELAAMAESLVNITSFKRRVSAEAETVGGPIDVAVISKKDGFIWIKRKHYFDPELNRDYFAHKYTRRGGESV